MPVVFVGHGSPTNAIEENEYSRAWAGLKDYLPRPKAILCISAHWQTRGAQVCTVDSPRTMYDFWGFPQPLYEIVYPAPGSPELANQVVKLVKCGKVMPEANWGLDHGAWCVLHHMYPQADIPVVQLSLDAQLSPEEHYQLARDLKALRQEGVLIMGSGNISHNLGMLQWGDGAYPWAVEFDQMVKELILSGDHASLVNYKSLGRPALLSIPTNEHYLPLLYALAQQEMGEKVTFFAEKVILGAISMRCVLISPNA
jgi:4,5-DOPA dioxygenase extradiol